MKIAKYRVGQHVWLKARLNGKPVAASDRIERCDLNAAGNEHEYIEYSLYEYGGWFNESQLFESSEEALNATAQGLSEQV